VNSGAKKTISPRSFTKATPPPAASAAALDPLIGASRLVPPAALPGAEPPASHLTYTQCANASVAAHGLITSHTSSPPGGQLGAQQALKRGLVGCSFVAQADSTSKSLWTQHANIQQLEVKSSTKPRVDDLLYPLLKFKLGPPARWLTNFYGIRAAISTTLLKWQDGRKRPHRRQRVSKLSTIPRVDNVPSLSAVSAATIFSHTPRQYIQSEGGSNCRDGEGDCWNGPPYPPSWGAVPGRVL
jgi:hypothetical protein